MCQKHSKRLMTYFSRFNLVDWLHVAAAVFVVAFLVTYACHFRDMNKLVFGNKYWYVYAIVSPVAGIAFVGCICQRKNIWLGVCQRCRLTEEETEILNESRDVALPGVGGCQSHRLNNEEQIDMGSVTSGSYASAVEAQLEQDQHCEESHPQVNIVDNSRRKSATSAEGEIPGTVPEVQLSNICDPSGYSTVEQELQQCVTETSDSTGQSYGSEIATSPVPFHPSPKTCNGGNTTSVDQSQYQVDNVKYSDVQSATTEENGKFHIAQEVQEADSCNRKKSTSQQESQLSETAIGSLNIQPSLKFVKASDCGMKIISEDQPQINGYHQDKNFSTPHKRIIKVQPDTPTINARTELLIKSTLSNVFDSPVRSATGPRDFRGYVFPDFD